MYLKLLKIIHYLPENEWKKILSPQDIREVFAPFHQSRKLKVQPTVFQQYDRDFILNYLEKNNIKEIIVPPDLMIQNTHLALLKDGMTHQTNYVYLEDLLEQSETGKPFPNTKSIYVEIRSHFFNDLNGRIQ